MKSEDNRLITVDRYPEMKYKERHARALEACVMPMRKSASHICAGDL